MGKLEDMERRISGLEKDIYDLKYPPRTEHIAVFTDGPMRGERKAIPHRGEYKFPLMPSTINAFTEYGGSDHSPFMVATYRPYAPLGPNTWEYRLVGYDCTGGH